MDFPQSIDNSLFLVSGPCVIESEDLCLRVAAGLREICERIGIPFVFKSSFAKANRTSIHSFQGPGLEAGLRTLAKVKAECSVPVLTDIHEPDQADAVAEVVDVIQIPAFLCRQTELILAAGRTNKIVNLKKGQFLAPWDMKHVVEKVESTGNRKIWLTERGTCFGYNTLVVDMRAIPRLKQLGCPVIFDATHSVQIPGGQGACTGGEREFVPSLAKAAVAAGADGLFIEVHEDPDAALSDGPNSLPLDQVEELLKLLLEIYSVVSSK